ncbi:MAG: metalloprotease [Rhodobacteraceae bacterium]|nr:metalloprotease [Paracoccaceae bacterium]
MPERQDKASNGFDAVIVLELLLSLILCAGTSLMLEGGWRGQDSVAIAGYDPQALGLGVLAIVAAVYLWGPVVGGSLILSVMLHEFGHVAAYRVCGHGDARFRLIPLIGGVAIADRQPESQEKAFFISLMGPAISIAPMILALSLSEVMVDSAPLASQYLWVFSGVMAALNFFNLLPLWPLDGANCLQRVIYSISPRGAVHLTYVMCGAMVAAALTMRSYLLLFFALASVRQLLADLASGRHQPPMSRKHGLLCLFAYGFTCATHLLGGYSVIRSFF